MKEINILYQFNDKYAPYAGVSITSLLANNTTCDAINIYLMLENVSSINIEKFQKLVNDYTCNLIIIDTEDLVKRMQQLGMPQYRDSYAANMRLFIAEYLPEDVERLIYIDSDTVILDSLNELSDFDLEGNVIGMVCDSVVQNYRKRIGLNEQDDYYNSGVILYDIPEWRKRNGTQRIIDHIKNVRSTYVSPDQDLLNVVFKKEIKRLPIRYNFQPIHKYASEKVYVKVYNQYPYYSDNEIKNANTNVAILHCFRFAGEFTWDKGNVHPMESEFDVYLRQSYWSDYVKIKKEISFMMKIEKVLYKFFPKIFVLRLFSFAHERYVLSKDNNILQGIQKDKA